MRKKRLRYIDHGLNIGNGYSKAIIMRPKAIAIDCTTGYSTTSIVKMDNPGEGLGMNLIKRTCT